MDNILFIYAIKASIGLCLFYGFYLLCLRNDTFLKLRRFYFLFSILFSLAYPLLSFELPQEETTNNLVEIPAYWLSGIEANIVPAEVKTPFLFHIQNVIGIIIVIISIGFLVRFIIQLLSVLKLRMDNDSEKIDCYRIVKLKTAYKQPFSFFKWIFLDLDVRNEEKIEEILIHEKIHAEQLHSVDVLFSEILCVCFWWNPVVWLMKQDIKSNLEYLADQGVLDTGVDTKFYQYALLQISVENTGISIINNFNVSQLKKRIKMMNKKRSHIVFSAKYLLIIPLGLALIFGNAVQAKTVLIDIPSEVLSLIPSMPAIDEIKDANEENVLQENNSISSENESSSSHDEKEDQPYVSVEKMPQFPGGSRELINYISANLKYPEVAAKAGLEGRVIVKFVVSRTGEITNVKIQKGLSPDADAEAIRVVKSMPKWIPGENDGKKVSVYFTLPIVYSLQKEAQVSIHVSVDADLPPDMEKFIKENPFVTVEKMPQFPGGSRELMNYISANLKYPEVSEKEGIEGRVVIRFVVTKTGDINDVEVIQKVSSDIDAEAVRIVSTMPKWIPGENDGKKVPVYFTLPLLFKLKKDAETETTT